MYDKKIKKMIFLLNIDNYSPEVTKITYPLIKRYAHKINADIYKITERKFPGWPPVYEKLQIYELAQKFNNDWNIYIDSDTLIHPDMFDITEQISKDTVVHNGQDMASHRWRYDRYFLRDGRNIGSCNWWAIASDWCVDLWKPLDDLTMEEAVARISPVVSELNGVTKADHLIDDFTLSRNIARFGLKHTTNIKICEKLGYKDGNPFLWHIYNVPDADKPQKMMECLQIWGVK